MRRFVTILGVILLAALAVVPAFAQVTPSSTPNSVTFNGFSFAYPSTVATNVSIVQFPGDATTDEYPGGPQPPYTQFVLYNHADGVPVPESPFEDDTVSITIYRVSDLVSYPNSQAQAAALQALLSSRPDLGAYMTLNDNSEIGNKALPALPVVPAAQVIRARAQYLDLGQFSGIEFVTDYRQDASPLMGNDLQYSFQGLSADGSVYVSLIAQLTSDVLPNTLPADFNYDTFAANILKSYNDDVTAINAAPDAAFTPSLQAIQTIARSFSVNASAVPPRVVVQPTAPAPEPTAVINTDPTLGGLAGEWNLVSFGAADAQMTPIEGAPVTISFSPQGVAGSDGCNSYGGNFSYDNGALTFSPLVSTLKACDEPIMTVATAYQQALQTVQSYAVSEDTLIINYDGGTLTYTNTVG